MGRSGKKRGRSETPGSTTNPRNKYSDNPPDFASLASLYPSFKPYVFSSSSSSRPRIDWTDYNATRELTRVLLLHDHSLNWWIPDGQLCPTVPNRSNYLHWINDLLSSHILPTSDDKAVVVKGFDIGTGANCIYPLLGASLYGWSFIGSDITDIALECAEKNVQNNPHISHLIEIRHSDDIKVLVDVVKESETFDFCMCNPPFFETFEESGLNPKTSCGGTHAEMVCDGGEQAFVTRIIQDSAVLKERFRWYTSMLGKKATLKVLVSKLWGIGVTVVKTTEFVQGQTSRWGLAWSFVPPVRKIVAVANPSVSLKKSVLSFMIEGIKREYSAADVLQSVEEFFERFGAKSKLNSNAFSVDIVASSDQCNTITNRDSVRSQTLDDGSRLQVPQDDLSFRVLVFQQMPGTLLIKGSLQHKDSPLSGLFSVVFGSLEDSLKSKFCR